MVHAQKGHTMTEHNTDMPDTPGEWWFTGTVYIPHSSSNGVTVHLATPRRVLMVRSPHFGLLPVDADTFICYGMYRFCGTWESKRRTITTRIPRELTEWMEATP